MASRASVSPATFPSWSEIVKETKGAPLNGYTRLPEGSVPSTAPDRCGPLPFLIIVITELSDAHPASIVVRKGELDLEPKLFDQG